MSLPQATVPPLISLASVEQITDPGIGIDMTALLVGEQTPTSPVVTLLDPNGIVVTGLQSPQVQGNLVVQPIAEGTLVPGTSRLAAYTMIVTFTPSGTTNILSTTTQIVCPY